jgi:hypothetical protein
MTPASFPPLNFFIVQKTAAKLKFRSATSARTQALTLENYFFYFYISNLQVCSSLFGHCWTERLKQPMEELAAHNHLPSINLIDLAPSGGRLYSFFPFLVLWWLHSSLFYLSPPLTTSGGS